MVPGIAHGVPLGYADCEVEFTVIELVAEKPPSTVVTVMVAEPAATAVTSPDELTVATELLLVDQFTFLFEAFDGATVAVNCCVAPTFTVADVGDTVTPVTGTLVVVTVIALVAVLPWSTVVTVIVADPCATAVTNPLALTVATPPLLVVHVTFLFVAFAGATAAVNCWVPPTLSEVDVGVTVTPVTGTLAVVLSVTLLKVEVLIKVLSCEHTIIPT